MAWQEVERDRCRCGHPRTESTVEGSRYRGAFVRCFACEAIRVAQDDYDRQPRGALWFAERA